MGKQERNAKCECGSGRKYKKCCRAGDEKAERISMFDKFRVMRDPRDARGRRYGLSRDGVKQGTNDAKKRRQKNIQRRGKTNNDTPSATKRRKKTKVGIRGGITHWGTKAAHKKEGGVSSPGWRKPPKGEGRVLPSPRTALGTCPPALPYPPPWKKAQLQSECIREDNIFRQGRDC